MKKLVYAFLFLTFCTIGFAQQKLTSADVLRLTIEHQILQHQLAQIQQRTQNLPPTLPTPKKIGFTPVSVTVKPYYKTAQIERMCELFPQCAAWAKKTYENAAQKRDLSWQIVEAKSSEIFYTPSDLFRYFGTQNALYQFLDISTSHKQTGKFMRIGRGENPQTWEESFKIIEPIK